MVWDQANLWLAFGLTAFAGMATGIGSLMAFFTSRSNRAFLSISLGFSAGVMVYVSFAEIRFKAQEALEAVYPVQQAAWVLMLAFFGGMLLILAIDHFVPDNENPHEYESIRRVGEGRSPRDVHLFRLGAMSALAVGIHNFPEGLATFMSALSDPTLGTSVAIAVAIHNIPEGIAVSIPIYYATGSRKQALLYSSLSGLSEPVGALVGYALLAPFFNELIFGIVFAAVAGIMVFISLDQLLPTARDFGKHHHAIYGMVAGMAVMAVSLVLFL